MKISNPIQLSICTTELHSYIARFRYCSSALYLSRYSRSLTAVPAPELYKIGYINVCKRAKTIIIIFYSNFREIYGLFLGGHRGPKIQTCSHKGKKMLKNGKNMSTFNFFLQKRTNHTLFPSLFSG